MGVVSSDQIGGRTRVEREANSPNTGELHKQHRRYPGNKQAWGRQYQHFKSRSKYLTFISNC
ncbi:hypothetical protein U9M48_019076 [Paspalum notatum var. saurae]|uniref:Uncharacterized protein n=1 Tax=Paspalum notatum var. saurae TaxID=547442 RepID=A0AAQ3WQV8_PASNO